MSVGTLSDWLDEHGNEDFIWYIKRLSGNDTLANGSHQAGPYIPRNVLADIFPQLNKKEIKNPDVYFKIFIDSHSDCRTVRAVWYNNKFHGVKNGRNETRITGFGGNQSALLNPENTGAIAVFAFSKLDNIHVHNCHVWICEHETEEEIVEDRVGPVEPGKWLLWPNAQSTIVYRKSCWLDENDIPQEWKHKFPSGAEIIDKVISLRPDNALNPDKRLLRRRTCEFEVFKSIEQAIELPNIYSGFQNIDSFIARAQTILQRRKARSGTSLELHVQHILREENLLDGRNFSHQPTSEPGKRPDFLFPSQKAYHDSHFPAERLRMLAVKTTCRDRWRQILNEADRVRTKHLLTLQEGISANQFHEMRNANVQLVVPEGLHEHFSSDIRPHLQTLESFIGDIRLL